MLELWSPRSPETMNEVDHTKHRRSECLPVLDMGRYSNRTSQEISVPIWTWPKLKLSRNGRMIEFEFEFRTIFVRCAWYHPKLWDIE